MRWERAYQFAACLVAAIVIAGVVTLAVVELWDATMEAFR